MSVKIVDNTIKVLGELDGRKKIIHTTWGEMAIGYAIDETPVDTGNLKNANAYEANEDKMILGNPTEYAIFVELGTSKQDAQPFIRPAIEDHKKEYEDIANKLLK